MRSAALLAVLLLASCHRPPPAPAPKARYVVGPAYQAAGVWHYPRESFRAEATGLAERLPDRTGLTANGEIVDQTAMAGAHQTLQLPAIIRVTNLENGRQTLIRLNDRGPANPGRLLGLTRRAADLLGLPASTPAQVRLQVESAPSQALRDQLQAGPAGVTAAPRATVATERLAPPAGTPARPVRVASALPAAQTLYEPDFAVPGRLPETVSQVPAQPGQLWISAGQFSQSRYANVIKSKLSLLPVQIRPARDQQSPGLLVMAGPFASVAGADAALDQARAAGVTDAVIVVETE